MQNQKLQNKKAFSLIELSIVILIIGVIVAGVSQSSRLINAMRLSSARSLTQSSPVNSIKDLAFWLETTSEKSFDAADQDDGLQVDNWYDINPQSNTKINFTQATSGQQPLYKTTGLNNIPALLFDGSNDQFGLTSSKIMSDFASTDQSTIFVVMKTFTAPQTTLFHIYKSSNNAIRILPSFPFNSSTLLFDWGTCCTNADGRINPASSYSSSYTNRTNVLTFQKKSTTAVVRVNGTQTISTAMTGSFSDTDLGSAVTFVLGNIDSGGTVLNGYFGEIIMFRRSLKSDEITDIEKYLGKKWGVTIP